MAQGWLWRGLPEGTGNSMEPKDGSAGRDSWGAGWGGTRNPPAPKPSTLERCRHQIPCPGHGLVPSRHSEHPHKDPANTSSSHQCQMAPSSGLTPENCSTALLQRRLFFCPLTPSPQYHVSEEVFLCARENVNGKKVNINTVSIIRYFLF